MSPDVVYGVHNNSATNIRRAILERVYFVEKDGILVPPPQPIPGAFQRLRGFKHALLGRMSPTTPVSREAFVGMYSGRRRTIYGNAAASLSVRPLEAKDAYLSSFVKCEKVNLSAKSDPAPRIIQPRNPRYNVEVGRYLKPLEHHLYRATAEVCGGPTVMKGYNAEEVGGHIATMWSEFRAPVAVGLDASRFDQHVSVDALSWEHSVYLALFRGDDKAYLRLLLSQQLENVGFARSSDGGYKYKVKGRRMSGDMNTALGNCLLMCAMVHSYCSSKGIRYRLANNGDDCTVIMERADLAAFLSGLREWFCDMGFTMKVEEPVFELEEIEFCQAHPVCVDGKWRMVRNPHTSMSKDCHTVFDMSVVSSARKYLGAIGECGLALASGVPVLQEFYKGMMKASDGDSVRNALQLECGMMMLSARMAAVEAPVAATTRLSFYKAFGITPDHQVALEDYHASFLIAVGAVARRENTSDKGYPL